MNEEIIINKFSELIRDGTSIVEKSFRGVNHRQIKNFQISAKNLIRIRFGINSVYYNDFMNTYKIKPNTSKYDPETEFYKRLTQIQTGVLEAILDALKNGLTDDLFYQKELLIFSDLIDQAFEFLEKGINLAAGIYGRVVLELTIKEFAKKHDIDSDLKFDQIIIKLRQNSFIHQNFETTLRANYLIGTWAAHGDEKFNKLGKNEIKEFLVFIRDKVLNLN